MNEIIKTLLNLLVLEHRDQVLEYLVEQFETNEIIDTINDNQEILYYIDDSTSDAIVEYVNKYYDTSAKIELVNSINEPTIVTFNTDLIDKQRMLQYLKDNIDYITLEDLETIRFNKL